MDGDYRIPPLEDSSRLPKSAKTYAEAGVNVARAEAALARVKAAVEATQDARVVGGHPGYSAVLELPGGPVALSTDSVGTKVLLHEEMGTYEAAGQDCVGMVLNDIAACGARPVAFLDYYATGRLDPERFARVVGGLAAACTECGAMVLGGETAEMPGVYGEGKVDVVGFGLGAFPAPAALLRPQSRLEEGDILIGLASSGFHSNGYSLVRALVASLGLDLHAPRPGGDTPLGLSLCEPTRLYPAAVALLQDALGEGLKGLAHITGGGLVRNLARILPPALDAAVDPGAFTRPAIVDWLVARSGLETAEAYATFNMGLGLVAAVPPALAPAALTALAPLPYPSWQVGRVEAGSGQARIG